MQARMPRTRAGELEAVNALGTDDFHCSLLYKNEKCAMGDIKQQARQDVKRALLRCVPN
jgi:hypothetical protein